MSSNSSTSSSTVTKTVDRIMEEAIKGIFPTNITMTVEGISQTISMHIRFDETVTRGIIFADVYCKEITNLHPNYVPPVKDYKLNIELTAVSQIVADKDSGLCVQLSRKLMEFVENTLTKSALSTATGLTVDAVLFDSLSTTNDAEDNIKTISLTIYVQA